jgi:tetratricopeptide (TPR) repeat protein
MKLYDDQFYIHILLKNVTTKEVEILEVCFSDPGNYFVVKPHPEYGNARRVLGPLQDTLVTYTCRVLVPRNHIHSGHATLTYRSGSTTKEFCLDFPSLDFSALHSPPLVGEAINSLLTRDVPKICDDVLGGQCRLIDIRGVSGVGKSRLLHELSARFREEGIITYEYDAMRAKDSVFRRLLADLAALPLYKGSLTHAAKQIGSLLRARGCASEYSEDISAFLITENNTWERLYSVTEGLKHFLRNPVREKPIAVMIDNVQEISPTGLQVLLQVSEFLQKSDARICLLIASNTEIMPSNIITPLAEFHEQLDSYGQDLFRTRRDIQPLAVEDAKLLLYSLLEGVKDIQRYKKMIYGDAVIDLIVKKAGTRPLDLLMAIQWLEEAGIIRRQGALTWFIHDFANFAKSVKLIPRGSAALICKRLKAIQHRVAPGRRRGIRNALQYLVAFSGRLPASFVERKVTRPTTEILLQHSILRQEFDGGSEFLVAFHDNIFRYLESSKIGSYTIRHSRSVLKWLSQQEEPVREELALVELFNGIRAGLSVAEVVELGERAISRSHGRSPSDVCEVGARLTGYIEKLDLAERDFQRYLPLKIRYANALIHQAAVTEGLQEFEDLHRYVRNGALLDTMARNGFYHQFINANLHSAQYGRALKILQERSLHPPADPEYEFLLCDRYGVAYTALGEITLAREWLSRALSIAREHQNAAWESIAHYDIGYTHIHITFDKEALASAFQSSLEAHGRSHEREVWREIEVQHMQAMIALLESRTEDAIEKIEDALWLSKRENQLYAHIKLLNLCGVCQVIAGRPDEAKMAFENSRSKAAMSFNGRAFWRAIANLGALVALSDGPRLALDYFSEAEAYLRKNLLQERGFAREIPIIANYISICSEVGDIERIEQLLTTWKDPRLQSLASSLSGSMPRRWRKVLGIVQHEGLAFLPT